MVPLPRYTTVGGIPVTELVDADKLETILVRTKRGGGECVKLMGTSAWYAPGASVAYLVDSILNDYKKIIPCSVFLDGEYNLRDICIGVPCIIGANGVESIIDIELNQSEENLLSESAIKVREMNTALSDFL